MEKPNYCGKKQTGLQDAVDVRFIAYQPCSCNPKPHHTNNTTTMAPKTTKGGKPKSKSKKNKGGSKPESELREEKERLEFSEKLALLEAEKNRDVALTEELERQTSHLKDDWEILKKEKRVSAFDVVR